MRAGGAETETSAAVRLTGTQHIDRVLCWSRHEAGVNDYNPLMKDFPINDLLSATELDRIRTSVQAIFTHLRKIRNTKYPIQRALRLVEAISRDVSSQMLKVLGTR